MAGSCLAVPFGPTPISRDTGCRLASAANLMGKLDHDPRVMASVRAGDRITVTEA
ncbi:cyclophilin-like family protein [Longimycelium tulufanense]|uniref:cyclophilin-like family protein n=1 Tax=Longimycelium tulufanense TaxID=907463 RepID=UPI003570D103